MALSKSPFHGKDIIYVHGLFLDVIIGLLKGHEYPAWPDDPLAFRAPFGYWRVQANGYWASHIQNFLYERLNVPRPALKNRYMIVGWSAAQSLETDANAILAQIADAMVNGNGVHPTDPSDPRKDPLTGKPIGFCVAGCIVISHSTGGALTDVAMAFAADPVYQHQQGTGPIQFIPEHVKVHAALAGAISGSQFATAAMVVAFGLTVDPPVCVVADLFLGLDPLTACDNDFSRLQDSVMWDLVPQVMQAQWGSRIKDTPVPVLTVAGASDHLYFPLKFFFQRGFDDGVVTMDSACGRTVSIWEWPSGFKSYSPTLNNERDPRLFDLGMTNPLRAVDYFLEQNYEWRFSFLFPILRAAGACAPSKAPWGMIEPIVPYFRIFGPLKYYSNHYSFLQTGEDHYDIKDRTDAPRWDTRAVLDPSIYATNPGGIALGLVRDELKTAEVQRRRGLPVTFTLFHHTFKWWIWKRTYHVVNGIDGASTDVLAAADYIYDYVDP
jgi:hypothetical protein